MSGYILDTNVISELTRKYPDPRVSAFISMQKKQLWLSPVVLHELEFGLQLLPEGKRRHGLYTLLSEFITEYEDRILPLAKKEAEWAARFRARTRKSGRVLDLGDALVAGTARAHDLSVATRNTEDFAGLDVKVRNPWETE